jgi:hypothetical protein
LSSGLTPDARENVNSLASQTQRDGPADTCGGSSDQSPTTGKSWFHELQCTRECSIRVEVVLAK